MCILYYLLNSFLDEYAAGVLCIMLYAQIEELNHALGHLWRLRNIAESMLLEANMLSH